MNWTNRLLVAAVLAAVAWPAMTVVSAASSISSNQRYQASEAPAYSPVRYRGFADPSFGPDGRPYRVPAYLRGQCYIDLGYGRFASCDNR